MSIVNFSVEVAQLEIWTREEARCMFHDLQHLGRFKQ